MSAWTNFRNALEALVDPEIAAATTFGQAVLSDTEAAASGNITTSFTNAITAFTETPGTLEVRVFAAGAAFVTALVGYEVSIIKKDAQAAITPATTTPAA
jgi:hypothetical protein